MKSLKSSSVLISGAPILFSESNAIAGGCISHIENKSEIKCFSDDNNYIDAKEKGSLYEVEA